ncbi:MAG: apolipoprotein N-acyltransferase [Gemmatimonadota bacterium]
MRRPALPPRPGLVLVSALLLGLAHPPFDLLFPSFTALIPFGIWLAGLPAGDGGRRAALRGGFLLGVIYYSLVFYWLLVALVFYTKLAILAFAAPVLILAGILGLATAGAHEAMEKGRWPVWLALPVFWTGAEWLRGHLGDVAFPWMGFGDTLTGYPWLVGAADVVGARGITFWLVLLNGLGAALVLRSRERRWDGGGQALPRPLGRLAAGALVVLLVPIAYSAVRWRTLATRPAATVAVFQPNIPEDLKMKPTIAADSAVVAIGRLVRSLPAGEVRPDLVVLPETVLPVFVDSIPSLDWPGRQGLRRWVADLARRFDAAVLYGAIGSRDLGDGDYEYFNSAFLVDGTGARAGRYDKRYLVPIVERVPFVDPARFRKLKYFGGFGVGRERPRLEAGGHRFGVLICYESIFAAQSRAHRRDGAEFLVNITNDAWFGRAEPWWSRSSALSQHPAHLVMRAIENRVGIARSANTGISGVVDPRGRWTERTALFEPDAFTAQVLTTDGLTAYARLGDVVGWAAALASLVGVLAGSRMRRRQRRPDDGFPGATGA